MEAQPVVVGLGAHGDEVDHERFTLFVAEPLADTEMEVFEHGAHPVQCFVGVLGDDVVFLDVMGDDAEPSGRWPGAR